MFTLFYFLCFYRTKPGVSGSTATLFEEETYVLTGEKGWMKETL
ncbi:hypothetical protein BACI349Y_620081 [Bacillus sp. 349Y]|jgi:hypothetical protein|nr:hypothetical protein BACI349Y_620081 [Bacillus sp. 349Y]